MMSQSVIVFPPLFLHKHSKLSLHSWSSFRGTRTRTRMGSQLELCSRSLKGQRPTLSGWMKTSKMLRIGSMDSYRIRVFVGPHNQKQM